MKRQYRETREWTPWGMSDSATEYGEGVTYYETPSHGGFKLSNGRLYQLQERLGNVTTFCGHASWFEEDCDWAHVATAFPELFTEKEREAAAGIRDWMQKRKAA